MKNSFLLYFLWISSIYLVSAQPNPEFYLHENGVTCMCPDADFGDTGTIEVNGEMKTFTKRSQTELENLINNDISNPEIALTCTSGIQIMFALFELTSFNQDIGSWDVSNVSLFGGLFNQAHLFNQDISHWDLSSAENIGGMFAQASSFNQDISNWEVGNVSNMNGMFANASAFNQDISNWDTSNVSIMNGMFLGDCGFNQDISNWDVSNVSSMDMMFFLNTNFIQDLSEWCLPLITEEPDDFANNSVLPVDFLPDWNADCVSLEIDGDFTFDPITQICYCPNADFGDTGTFEVNGQMKTFTKRTETELRNLINNFANDDSQDISLTCTSGISNMTELFEDKEDFNLSLVHWDVSNVTEMSFMFSGASSFNQNIGNWDVSNVTLMNRMFSQASSFNQDISNWEVSNVTDMSFMFIFASEFNQPLEDWDVSNVVNMAQMLAASSYNQPLNSWNMTNVTDINAMFAFTPFNHPLNQWDVSNVTNMSILFRGNDFFNQDLSEWDVSNVTEMQGMFWGATSFVQNLNSWDVSSVTKMSFMFSWASNFNQALSQWDVSNVSEMDSMFDNALIFNQDLSSWCVESILDEPEDFSTGSPLQENFQPNWGEECESFSLTNEAFIDFDYYPNPVEQILNFTWNSNLQGEAIQINIYSIKGKKIIEKNYNTAPESIKLSNLPTGVYLLKITYNNQSAIKKIIKD